MAGAVSSQAAAQFTERRSGAGSPAPYWLLLAFLMLLYGNLPLLFPALDAVRPAKVVAGLALVTLAGEALVGRRKLRVARPEGFLLLGFLAVAAISCLDALWPRQAVESTLDLFKMILVYFFIANCATTARRVRGVMWTMAIGGLFPAVGALTSYARGEMLEGRAVWLGIFANPNELAYSLVILVPIAAVLMTGVPLLVRAALLGMIALYLAAIFVAFSRGGLLGLAAVAAIYSWRKQSMALRVAVVVLMVCGLLYTARHWTRSENFTNLSSDMSFQQRIATSRVGLAVFADRPLTGVGLGCSIIAWPLYAPKDLYSRGSLVTHNTLIQPLAETGVPGFLLFAAFIGYGIYRARKLARFGAGLESALWGFVVCGLSGGYVLTWFPYILTGMVSACRMREAA